MYTGSFEAPKRLDALARQYGGRLEQADMVNYFGEGRFEPEWDEALVASLQEPEETFGWKQAVRDTFPFAEAADWELKDMS